jgi:hypothetical protein
MSGPHPYFFTNNPKYGFPGCYATLSWGTGKKPFPAILDTGSDYTFIPSRFVKELHLKPVVGKDDVLVSAPLSTEETQQGFYAVNLEFLGFPHRYHPVLVVDRDWPEIIIGRDILNKYVITLNGPNLEFSIDSPPKALDTAQAKC